jgi:two-component system NtrC family sensor kinase
MAGERILIIDDSQEIISFLLAILQPLGYVVSYTMDGKEGLTKAVYEKPDLILLDLNLPGLSGMAILEALFQRGVQVPVIIMSLHGAGSVVERASRLGARDYMVKPFEVEEILASIERVLGETHSQRGEHDLFAADFADVYAQPNLEGAEFESLVKALSIATSMKTFLSQATEAALRLTRADVCTIFLRDESNQTLMMSAVRQGQNYRSDVHVSDSHVESVLRTGQPLMMAAATTKSSFVAQLGVAAQMLLYVPIFLRERVVGVIGVAYVRQGVAPSADTQHWLGALGAYCGILMEDVHLRDVMRKSVPLQKVFDVLGILARPMIRLLQALSAMAEGQQDPSEPDVVRVSLAREVKTLNVILSVFKDIASPKSSSYIGTVSTADIEKEMGTRLASIARQ